MPLIQRLPFTICLARASWRLLVLASCSAWWLAHPDRCTAADPSATPVPLTSHLYDQWSDAPKRDKTLFIFLPGRGTDGQDFVRQGFLEALSSVDSSPSRAAGNTAAAKHGPPIDALTVDLTYPYYVTRTAVPRLHEDILVPARAAGYRQIWLVGCSVGALGAIFYNHDHPGEISGIVALGPYLGEKEIAREIEAAGGLARWQPAPGVMQGDDFRRQLWVAIRQARFDQPGHLPLVVGYGKLDRFAAGQRLLAGQLPADHVFTQFGFHDWGTWQHLWREILGSPVSPLPAASGGRTTPALNPARPAFHAA